MTKDDWNEFNSYRSNYKPPKESTLEKLGRFLVMLFIFLFLLVSLGDVSPLISLVFSPLETICNSGLK